MANQAYPAVLWEPLDEQQVHCFLCNFHCRIKPGAVGHCQVRANQGGKLVSLNYQAICATHVDPIEKKPLFHFQPGSRSFSLAAVGCNFRCDFCQNWQISQWPRMREELGGRACSPEEIVSAAQREGCRSISYTYTEPTIFMELAADCGRLARQRGLANVFVSNGYLTTAAVDFAREWLDAINVDLKGFTEEFYQKVCKARLGPVLETLRYIARQTEIWLEVTTLVIPGLNDSAEELRGLARFIAGELGEQVPWHVSRFHPDFERAQTPATPVETLELAYELGREAGLRYIYVGNLPGAGHESTVCPECGQLLIERFGYRLGQFLVKAGNCPACGTAVAGKDIRKI